MKDSNHSDWIYIIKSVFIHLSFSLLLLFMVNNIVFSFFKTNGLTREMSSLVNRGQFSFVINLKRLIDGLTQNLLHNDRMIGQATV